MSVSTDRHPSNNGSPSPSTTEPQISPGIDLCSCNCDFVFLLFSPFYLLIYISSRGVTPLVSKKKQRNNQNNFFLSHDASCMLALSRSPIDACNHLWWFKVPNYGCHLPHPRYIYANHGCHVVFAQWSRTFVLSFLRYRSRGEWRMTRYRSNVVLPILSGLSSFCCPFIYHSRCPLRSPFTFCVPADFMVR